MPNKTPKKTRITRPVDHEGNQFNSLQEMCDHWGIKKSTFMDRRQHGWSLEECLAGRNSRIGRNGKTQDHNGAIYLSEKAMCDAYGINYSSFRSQRRRGITLKECLTPKRTQTVTDHHGNKFKTRSEMCEFYGVDPSTFKNRIDKNWSLEKALTTPSAKDAEKLACKDHTGKKYESTSAMCKAYGVEIGTYQRRLERGWDIERALTESVETQEYIDPFGNKYDELKSMLAHYNVNLTTYYQRINTGHTLEEALGIVPIIGPNTIGQDLDEHLCILRPIPDEMNGKAFYFKCVMNEELTVMTRKEIVNYLMQSINAK